MKKSFGGKTQQYLHNGIIKTSSCYYFIDKTLETSISNRCFKLFEK